ncbi:MAG: hypothetical protein SWK90_18330 [Chloroflexota bacterium]|nr:hypothetical protein [Chloroflexota bacterium]
MWIYGLISLFVLTTSFFLFRNAAGTMSIYKLNIVSWTFYYHLFLQSFIGINLVVVFGVYHYLMSRASADSLLMAYWAICYAMLMMPLTMILVQELFFGGRIGKKVNAFFAAKIAPLQSRRDSTLVIFWRGLSLLALLATLYVYYQVKTPPFVIFFTYGTTPEEFARLRIAAKRGFTGNRYVLNLFSLLLAPFVSYVAYGYHRLYRESTLHRLWFYFTVIVSVLAVTYDGEKAPVIYYAITLFFIKSFINGGIKKGQLLTILLATFVLIVTTYVITSGTVNFAINSGPGGRILMTQVGGLPLHFEVFPNRVPFLKGASFPAWMSNSVFGVEHARSARVLVEVYNPRGIQAGTAGVINTLFMGEAWANFGWFGFLLAPIVVGVVVQFIHNLLVSLPKTPLSVAPMGYFMFRLGITGGFVGFVWNATWLVLLVIIIVGLCSRSFLLAPSRNRYRRQTINVDNL